MAYPFWIRAILHGELFSAFSAPPFKNQLPVARGHSFSKTVHPVSSTIAFSCQIFFHNLPPVCKGWIIA
jgi:hypothetical protein